MRIASNIDFDSIVKKPAAPIEASPQRMPCVALIHDWNYSDYRYRIFVKERQNLAALSDALNATKTYDIYKDEINATPHQRKKYKVYEMLWFDIMDAYRKVYSEGQAV